MTCIHPQVWFRWGDSGAGTMDWQGACPECHEPVVLRDTDPRTTRYDYSKPGAGPWPWEVGQANQQVKTRAVQREGEKSGDDSEVGVPDRSTAQAAGPGADPGSPTPGVGDIAGQAGDGVDTGANGGVRGSRQDGGTQPAQPVGPAQAADPESGSGVRGDDVLSAPAQVGSECALGVPDRGGDGAGLGQSDQGAAGRSQRGAVDRRQAGGVGPADQVVRGKGRTAEDRDAGGEPGEHGRARPKRKRVHDPAALAAVRARCCLVCGDPITDPDHITTRGAGGDDSDENLRPLCRIHHDARHDGNLHFEVADYTARLS